MGFTRNEILTLQRQFNRDRCVPPEDDAEIVKIADSAGAWEPGVDDVPEGVARWMADKAGEIAWPKDGHTADAWPDEYAASHEALAPPDTDGGSAAMPSAGHHQTGSPPDRA